ncbi:ABC transporter ATP-binding protein [bacterium]|nr:MAG: ABC transporter ATP-binding protein [bacterium]
MLKVFKTLKPYMKGEGLVFFLGILALILVDSFQLLIPRIIKRAVDALSFGRANTSLLLKLGLFIIVITIGIVITRFIWRYFIIGISRRMEKRLRRAFYKHLQTLSPGWYAKHKIGDLMALATNDLEAVRMMVGIGMVATFDAVFLMVASLAMMIIINPKLTLYVIIPLPVLSVVVGFFGKILHRRFKLVQESFATLTDRVREIVSGIRVVKSYARQDFETERFKDISKDYVHKNIRMIIIGGMFEPLIGLVVGFSFAMVLLFGGRGVILASMSMGDFVAFNSYLGLLIWPMIAVGWVINLYQRGKASLDRIVEIFEQEPDIVDTPDAIELEEIEGKIEFRNLTFRYNPELPPELQDINFTIQPGEFVGITGRTGSGKSTLIALIPRLYDPPQGTVFIDDVDVRNVKLSSLRSKISITPQDTFLFSASLLENIKFGNVDIPDEKAIEAAKIAQLDKDVSDFPNGYETMIGERGVTLSGGQKQRLSIARAIVLDLPILILDDALSAVDTETENAILEKLIDTRRGKTTIIISHRVSALQNASKVIVLDRGKLVEQGTHNELLDEKGYYFELYQMQQIQSELNSDE